MEIFLIKALNSVGWDRTKKAVIIASNFKDALKILKENSSGDTHDLFENYSICSIGQCYTHIPQIVCEDVNWG